MDKRIKELAVQAGMEVDLVTGGFDVWFSDGYYIDVIERFAQLVRDDERDKCAQDYLQDCCDAIAAAEHNEREACAKLCESKLQQTPYGGLVAAAIRARSEPSPAFKNYMDDNWAGIV